MAAGMVGVEDGWVGEECGELGGGGLLVVVLCSSDPPSIEEMDMPVLGRCRLADVEKLAMSRMPAKGEVVGGPRGAAEGKWVELEEEGGGGICGGTGGGMLRVMKAGGGDRRAIS